VWVRTGVRNLFERKKKSAVSTYKKDAGVEVVLVPTRENQVEIVQEQAGVVGEQRVLGLETYGC
jgi:hypothetical protein